MNIAVIGTGNKEKALRFKVYAGQFGKILAEKGHTLITGAGEGISKLVVDAYRLHGGCRYTAFLPFLLAMKDYGEEIGPKPDFTVKTEGSYTKRNEIMISTCDGVVLVGDGGKSTLGEVVLAFEYKKPISVLTSVDSRIAEIAKTRIFKGDLFVTQNVVYALDRVV